MKIKHQLPFGLGFALTSLVLSGTLPAQAQTGNQSDVTGVITTTSDVAGGAFAPAGGSGGTLGRFSNSEVSNAINQAAETLNTQVEGGTLPVAASNVPTTSIPASVQQSLLSLLTGTGNVAATSSQIESALANAAGATNPTLAQDLVSSLQGLTASGVSPVALANAVDAYNALIDASSGGFLSNPPPELLAIQSALSSLVNAALEGS